MSAEYAKMQAANDAAVEVEIRAMTREEAIECAIKMQHAYDDLMRAVEDVIDDFLGLRTVSSMRRLCREASYGL